MSAQARWPTTACFAALAALALAGAVGLGRAAATDRTICRAELRSWIVAGRGRHLYLQITCPPPYRALSGRVEFTEARLRTDYRPPVDPARRNRVARMNWPFVLQPPPFIKDKKDRLEARFTLTLEQVECLRRDRMFTARYELLGPNSNAALRRVAADCGCPLPAGMLTLGGLLGDFPGIEADVGPELPPDQWSEHGIETGPQPLIGAAEAAASHRRRNDPAPVRTLPAP